MRPQSNSGDQSKKCLDWNGEGRNSSMISVKLVFFLSLVQLPRHFPMNAERFKLHATVTHIFLTEQKFLQTIQLS